MGRDIENATLGGKSAEATSETTIPQIWFTLTTTPWVPYVLPMAIYIAFSAVHSWWPETFVWLYPIKVILVGASLLGFRKKYEEFKMPQRATGEATAWANTAISYSLAIVIGLVAIVVWIGADPFYPGISKLMGGKPYLPFDPTTIQAVPWRYVFIGFRLFGAVLVVAFMEEIFWRGYLIRWVSGTDFKLVPVGTCSWAAFGITTVLFGVEHEQWMAGIVCGALYNWLYCRCKDLFSCVLSHATSNAALAAWVLWRGDWKFW